MEDYMVFIIIGAVVFGILILKYILRALANKGINAAENAIAKKKNENHTNGAEEETKLSDMYKK